MILITENRTKVVNIVIDMDTGSVPLIPSQNPINERIGWEKLEGPLFL